MANGNGGVNAAHVIATGGITSALSTMYEWLLHWPWTPPTGDQADALAMLTMAALGGGGFAVFKALGSRNDTPSAAPPAPVTAAPLFSVTPTGPNHE